MKCPKCGYTSFDDLQSCSRCGDDLTAFKARFNLRSILFSGKKNEPVRSRAASASESDLSQTSAAAFPAEASPISGSVFGDEPDTVFVEEAAAGDEFTDFSWPAAGKGPPGDAIADNRISLLDDPAFASPAEAGLRPDEPEPDRPSDLTRDAFEADLQWPESGGQEDFGGGTQAADQSTGVSDAAVAATDLVVGEEEREEGPIRLSLEEFFPPEPEKEAFLFGSAADPMEPESEQSFLPRAPDGGGAGRSGIADAVPAAASGRVSARSRLTAALADFLILAAIFLVFLFAGELALEPVGVSPARPLSEALLEHLVPYFLVLFFLGFGYFTLSHFLLGQTVGKILFRLRVETEAGAPVSFSHAFLRSAGGLLSLLAAGIGYLPILSPEGRGWNDRLAGTRVVGADPQDPGPG